MYNGEAQLERRAGQLPAWAIIPSLLTAVGLYLSPAPAYSGNLITLESEYLGDGTFEYRLACNWIPYVERSGLSNFSLAFPGFDAVVQEPEKWQRAPGFPTSPQSEASLQWLHSQTNHEGLPYPCVFRLRSQRPAFRLGVAEVRNVLHWNDWAQPRGYSGQVQERLTIRCLVPCDTAQSDGSPGLYGDAVSDFPEVDIAQVIPASAATLRLGIVARPGLPLSIETTEDLRTWHRVGFVTAASPQAIASINRAQTGDFQFYRAVAKTPEFAHPEAFASTQWLEQHLGDPSVRIVDSRYPQSDGAFASGHIPGAVKVDPLIDLLDPSSAPAYLVPTPAQFESLMGRLGISNTTTVVVYDLDGGLWCCRLWWALRYYGHENVKVLHGGWPKWQAELRPVEKSAVLPPTAVFTAKAQSELRADFGEVQSAIGNTNVVIVDVLSVDQHVGTSADMPALPPGHIPASKNVPAPSNLDTYHMLRLPPETLAATYVRAGAVPEKQIITYCGGGYYGAFSLFVLYQLGYEKIKLYDGAWADWVARGGAIETGP